MNTFNKNNLVMSFIGLIAHLFFKSHAISFRLAIESEEPASAWQHKDLIPFSVMDEVKSLKGLSNYL